MLSSKLRIQSFPPSSLLPSYNAGNAGGHQQQDVAPMYSHHDTSKAHLTVSCMYERFNHFPGQSMIRKYTQLSTLGSSLFLYRLSRRNNESWPSFPFQGYSNSLSKKLSFKKSHNGCPLVVQVKCCISSRAAYTLVSVMRHKWREAKAAQSPLLKDYAPFPSTPHHKLGCRQACSLSETHRRPLYKVVKVPPPRPPWLLLRYNPSP